MKTIKRTFLLIIIAVLPLWLISCDSKQAEQNISDINLSVLFRPTASADMTPIIAQEKGFFKEQRLHVTLVSAASPKDMYDRVIAGTDAVAAAALPAEPLFNMAFSGKPPLTAYLFTLWPQSGDFDGLIVREDSPIRDIPGLKDKKIGHIPSVQMKDATIKILKKLGGFEPNPDLIVGYNPIAPLQALQGGQVDALLTFEPIISNALASKQNSGHYRLIASSVVSKAYGNKVLPGGVAVFNTSWANENKSTVQKYLIAIRKALKFIRDNPTEAAAFLSDKKYGGYERAVCNRLSQPVIQLYDEVLIDEWQMIADVWATNGLLSGKIDVKGIIYHP